MAPPGNRQTATLTIFEPGGGAQAFPLCRVLIASNLLILGPTPRALVGARRTALDDTDHGVENVQPVECSRHRALVGEVATPADEDDNPLPRAH